MVRHPTRRKIIILLMILGNAGIVAVMVATTTSLVISKGYRLPLNILFLFAGMTIIYRLATWKGLIRKWENYIENRLVKHELFEEAPIDDLLHLLEGYGLVRAIIGEGSPWIRKTISELRSGEKGFLFLGIERGHDWIPKPRADEKVYAGDRIVIYGPMEALKERLKD